MDPGSRVRVAMEIGLKPVSSTLKTDKRQQDDAMTTCFHPHPQGWGIQHSTHDKGRPQRRYRETYDAMFDEAGAHQFNSL